MPSTGKYCAKYWKYYAKYWKCYAKYWKFYALNEFSKDLVPVRETLFITDRPWVWLQTDLFTQHLVRQSLWWWCPYWGMCSNIRLVSADCWKLAFQFVDIGCSCDIQRLCGPFYVGLNMQLRGEVQEFVKTMYAQGQTVLQSRERASESQKTEKRHLLQPFQLTICSNVACIELLLWAITEDTGRSLRYRQDTKMQVGH